MQLIPRGVSSIDLPPTLMRSFFEVLFQKIIEKVQELSEQAKNKKGRDIDFIFMVGGFSESPFLKAQIKQHFETEMCQVLVPRRP
jgi:molecular chaperone DnaK (HSP70)